MPTYQVYANKNRLTRQQKKQVAAAITDGHIAMTGAPRYYVQVILHEVSDEDRFIAGKEFGDVLWIRGDVRIRTPEQNKELMTELIDRVGAVSDFDKSMIWCDLSGVEPTNIMKFGTVFPPAGEEQAWYDALPDDVKQVIQNLLKEQS